MTNWYLTSVLRRFNESRIVFQQMMLGQPNIHMQKNEVGPEVHNIYKNALQLDPDPNVKTKTIKS